MVAGDVPPAQRMLGMIGGFQLSQAARVEANPDALHRLLRYLASHGVFAEDDAGLFGLTPLAELLPDDVPGVARGDCASVQRAVVLVKLGRPATARGRLPSRRCGRDGQPGHNHRGDAGLIPEAGVTPGQRSASDGPGRLTRMSSPSNESCAETASWMR
jgi:hypothetical protein